MKAALVLGLVGLQASLVVAGFDDFDFYSKCSASSSAALWSSLDECSTTLRAKVTKTCNANKSFDYCACDWGTSYMSTCLTLVCPTDIASSYIAYDPAQRTTDCPALLTGGAGLAEPTATATPGSGSNGDSSPTTAGTGGAAATSKAGAANMAMPIAGGVFAGAVGGLAVFLVLPPPQPPL
ncbi:hypothetical protein B0H67DRAFT_555967 [Lasiosphaeris hirsuta]|uniref:Extracellular membrane protein CFEM domain-containing protein n=1 Tax=Lasiosphaeris hirsuta TaxID=260670 RepID=A0AA40DQU2_9PEZI|nr:hypothetical protein B0H67DRAFT_555967 [Lasiosphaeris hirsuta]